MLVGVMATTLLLGVSGGFHCVAMCAAPCARLTRMQAPEQPSSSRTIPIATVGDSRPAAPAVYTTSVAKAVALHGGRMLSYALLGAVAAGAVGGFAQLAEWSSALRPLWALLQLAVLFVGLGLLVWGSRAPSWLSKSLAPVGLTLQRWLHSPTRLGLAGLAWAGLPCGLLYSAAAIAALTGRVVDGALAMALFAAGSTLWLLAAPWILRRMQYGINAWRQELGARLAGATLVGMSAWALGSHAMHGTLQLWC